MKKCDIDNPVKAAARSVAKCLNDGATHPASLIIAS